MAYLDLEMRNVRLIWEAWGDRVLAIGLIVVGLLVAHVVAGILVPGAAPIQVHP
jgi:hypothetical protein